MWYHVEYNNALIKFEFNVTNRSGAHFSFCKFFLFLTPFLRRNEKKLYWSLFFLRARWRRRRPGGRKFKHLVDFFHQQEGCLVSFVNHLNREGMKLAITNKSRKSHSSSVSCDFPTRKSKIERITPQILWKKHSLHCHCFVISTLHSRRCQLLPKMSMRQCRHCAGS